MRKECAIEEGFWVSLGQWGKSLFVFGVGVVCGTMLQQHDVQLWNSVVSLSGYSLEG